jgi:hypothetical protein
MTCVEGQFCGIKYIDPDGISQTCIDRHRWRKLR